MFTFALVYAAYRAHAVLLIIRSLISHSNQPSHEQLYYHPFIYIAPEAGLQSSVERTIRQSAFPFVLTLRTNLKRLKLCSALYMVCKDFKKKKIIYKMYEETVAKKYYIVAEKNII